MSINRSASSFPTIGQLERELSQKISALYRTQFGHQVSKVDCHLFDNKLIVFFEDVITPVEQVLIETESLQLLSQVRAFLDRSIQPKLENLIKEIIKVEISKCIYNTAIEAESAIAIIILVSSPQVRSKKYQRKHNKKNVIQFSQIN